MGEVEILNRTDEKYKNIIQVEQFLFQEIGTGGTGFQEMRKKYQYGLMKGK